MDQSDRGIYTDKLWTTTDLEKVEKLSDPNAKIVVTLKNRQEIEATRIETNWDGKIKVWNGSYGQYVTSDQIKNFNITQPTLIFGKPVLK